MSVCEKKCDQTTSTLKPLSYKLPNGEILSVDPQCQTTDLFFRGLDDYGTQNLVLEAIYDSPLDYQLDLSDNIILAGGTTKFCNFTETFWNQLNDIGSGKNANFNIIQNYLDDQDTMNWKGAKILGSLDSFEFVDRSEYQEFGSTSLRV